MAQRADGQRRVEQLMARVTDSARYQEGETPVEDAQALLTEIDAVLDQQESLIRRINRTNAATPLGDGTVTDALARRDVLRYRHRAVTAAADAASGRGGRDHGRHMRSELVSLPALPVAELRAEADRIAQEIRELDIRIQRANWEVELLD
ncbi:DIP1984 family protein [Saccharopolyspora montiporae]|uniref:DIP1984 family protein n=1 Tax=Saccharopolyspora montiporae TaxID=2781240 RepID=UPI001D13AB3C|nr:DIP1984 family protein [Saccharopolyspora sp. HNM0983]